MEALRAQADGSVHELVEEAITEAIESRLFEGILHISVIPGRHPALLNRLSMQRIVSFLRVSPKVTKLNLIGCQFLEDEKGTSFDEYCSFLAHETTSLRNFNSIAAKLAMTSWLGLCRP